MNTAGWKIDLQADFRIANELLAEMKKVTPEHDKKLQDLKSFIGHKIHNPINGNNKKCSFLALLRIPSITFIKI